MNIATRPSGVMPGIAPSCLKRPIAVRLTGVDSGSAGFTSTIQPWRFGSFGSSSMLKRLSNRPQAYHLPGRP